MRGHVKKRSTWQFVIDLGLASPAGMPGLPQALLAGARTPQALPEVSRPARGPPRSSAGVPHRIREQTGSRRGTGQSPSLHNLRYLHPAF